MSYSNFSEFRLKDVAKLSSGLTPKAGDTKYYDDGIVNWLNTGDLNDGIIVSTNKKISTIALEDYPTLKINEKGTVVIAMYGATIGKLGILEIRATTNQACCCIVSNTKLSNKFLFYFLLSRKDFIISLSVGGTQPNVSQSILSFLKVYLPPYSEQTAIANYLDRKTSTIDKKTALLNQKIETYKKLRKAIINKAVTKGLDNKVELKESDLGFSVPVHWKKVRLKDIGNLYSGLSGKSGDDFNQEDNLNNKSFIPFTNIANNTYLDKEHLGTVVVGENENQNAVKKGDIFFLMSSEGYDDIGKTAVLVDDLKETYLNSFCKGFRINKTKTNSNFLNYALLSDFYRKRMIVEGKGFTRINLKMEKVSNFEMNLPTDVKEQHQIAEYLDQKTATIDKIVANLQTQIAMLQHLRKGLINDAVTGKIKVV